MSSSSNFLNPFRPGIGTPPPLMGRRPNIEQVLKTTLNRLKTGEVMPNFAYLYGPRGNGKTVLLRWLEEQAASVRVLTITLDPIDLVSHMDLVAAVLKHVDPEKSGIELKNVLLKIPLLEAQLAQRDRPVHTLTDVLKATKRPLLIILDEAHTDDVSLGVLKTLMNAVQTAGSKIPIALVLAGTPGLEDKLRATGASYWSRSEKLPIGRLSTEASVDVITLPLDDMGIVADPVSVERLVHVANRYSYFLQLYGHAAFDAVQESGTNRFGPREFEVAVTGAMDSRTDYYMDRFQEFDDVNELQLARSVALAFKGHVVV